MTELAGGVVYGRSGSTHQAGLLEKAGLITRGSSPEDQRATLVIITDAGLALVAEVLPGHIQVARRLLFDPLSQKDLHDLGEVRATGCGSVSTASRGRPHNELVMSLWRSIRVKVDSTRSTLGQFSASDEFGEFRD